MIPGVFRTADTCSRWLCKVDRNYMYIPCWICLCLWSLVSITSCYRGVFFVECQSNADYRKESVKQYTNVNCSEIVAISCIAIFCPHYMLTCWLTLNQFLSDQSGWSITPMSVVTGPGYNLHRLNTRLMRLERRFLHFKVAITTCSYTSLTPVLSAAEHST